jgi:hypothetical protein
VTVDPTGSVIVGGAKLKLSIFISSCAAELRHKLIAATMYCEKVRRVGRV